MNYTDNPEIDGIARRTFLKGGALLGATALLAGGTGSVTAQDAAPIPLEAELEGPLMAVDTTTNTINVMGISVNVTNASFASPTAALTIEDLVGDPLPGRGTTAGFIGGTAIVTGTTTPGDTDYTVTASSVFVEVAENVILGEVTENTLTGPTFESGGSFVIQGVKMRPVGDPRLPFSASTVGLPINVSTIDPGTAASPEGHFGNDGVLYAHTLEIEGAGVELIDPEAVSITRVGCDEGGRLEVQGGSGIESAITIYDDNTDAVLGTTNATLDPEAGVATYRFRRNISVCPTVVRVKNEAGSTATIDVATGAPVPGDEEPEEPPEEPAEPTQTLKIQGEGSYASYSLTVDGEIVASKGISSEDLVADNTATGAVRAGSESYTFTGAITNFTLNGTATVTLNDLPYDVDRPLSNTLTIRGNDRLARYAFTVSEGLAGSDALTDEDSVDGLSATGAVRRGQDTYYYSGTIEAFEFTDGIATIIQNGNVVTDPTQP